MTDPFPIMSVPGDADFSFELFPVQLLSSVQTSSGVWLYAWQEQTFDPSSGAYSPAPSGRGGDTTSGPFLQEANNQSVATPAYAWVRLVGIIGGQPQYEFCASNANVGPGGTVTYGPGTTITYGQNTTISYGNPTTLNVGGPLTIAGAGPVTVSGPPFLFKTPTTLVQPIFAPQDNSYTGGPTTALTLSTGCWLRISTDTLGVTIQGIGEGISAADGEELLLTNVNALAGGLVTLLNESTAESYTAARIWTPDGNNFVLQPRESAWLRYDGDVSRWRVLWKLGGTGGTVTSVGLAMPAEFTVSGSPVTTAGTLTAAKAAQSANTVWAGPSSGAAAAPTFRTIGASDLAAWGAASNTATSYTGTTTTAGVVVFDAINNNGLHGSFVIKNTGVNPLSFQITTTDFFGTNYVLNNQMPPGGIQSFLIESISSANPPFKEVKLVLSDGGSATTYTVWLSLVG